MQIPLAHLTPAEIGTALALFLAGALCGAWIAARLARPRRS
jgi:hypothetical protein